MHTALLSPGETTHRQFGALLVRIDRHHEGVTINVIGEDDLRRQFTDLAEGRKYVAFLAQAGRAGQPVHEIVQAAGVLTSAAAVFDELADEVLDNAKPATLDAYRQTHRATPTRTGVHTKPLTTAERARIHAHNDGVVTLLPGQSWLMLRAIHRRIGGERTYKPGTRIIAALRLTDEQIAEVAA